MYCPFENEAITCDTNCPCYYYENGNNEGCSLKMIAYYLNWLCNLLRAKRGD